MRKHLFITVEQGSSVDSGQQSYLLLQIMTVQFWTILSVDTDSEEQGVELLKENVEMWVTARGSLIAGTSMDGTILTCHSNNKGVNKELKRSGRRQQIN